jgi:hypothetical protein
VIVETASGGNSGAARVALGRHGQLGSVLGQTAGYVGLALGTVAASLLTMAPRAWLAAALLVGAVLALRSTLRSKLWCVDHDAMSAGHELTFKFRRRETHVECLMPRMPDGTCRAPYELLDGDILDGRRGHDDQDHAERREVLQITVTAGAPWWVERQLSRWMGSDVYLIGRLARSIGWFTTDDFSVAVRWRTLGALRCVAVRVDGGLDLRLTLPDEQFQHRAIRWALMRGFDHSELRDHPWRGATQRH